MGSEYKKIFEGVEPSQLYDWEWGSDVSEMKRGLASFPVLNFFEVFDTCEKCDHI